MEKLYRPLVGREIDKKILNHLKRNMQMIIQEVIAAHASALDESKIMLFTILLPKLVERLLALDDAAAPFTLLGVEVGRQEVMGASFALNAHQSVRLSGVIDRIDRSAHTIRIIDYKTSVVNGKISNIAALFDGMHIKNNKAVFQVLFYAWIFKVYHAVDSKYSIMPYLIGIRKLFVEANKPGIFIQQPDHANRYMLMEDMGHYTKAFEEGLLHLLLDIFDPMIPFSQTTNMDICASCPYVRICQRD